MDMLDISGKIKALIPGTSFIVGTNSERVRILAISRTLLAAGMIKFDIVTRRLSSGKYQVLAARTE